MQLNQLQAFSSTIEAACSTVGSTPSIAGEIGKGRSNSGNEYRGDKATSV